jgi:hypothetical protein
MLLITALIVILIESIGEGLLKRFNSGINEVIFDAWIQWVIALMFFGCWFVWALHFDSYFVPVAKLIIGFVFVRFATFDITWNLARGVKWNYYGTTKWYDRTMTALGSFGYLLKFIAGFMGVCFLLGIESMDDIINMFK